MAMLSEAEMSEAKNAGGFKVTQVLLVVGIVGQSHAFVAKLMPDFNTRPGVRRWR